MRKYWEIDPDYQIIMDSDEDYFQRFRDIFAEAIKCRLRSSFPLGFELSGGLDSSSVVCMAKHILNNEHSNLKKISTFSMVFNDFPKVDERYYIKKVIDDCGINPQLIISDKISPLENIESILNNQEQPFYTPNIPILKNMYKTMYDNNVRVLLGGHGGDQTISHGKYYLRELATNMQWEKLIKEINGYSKRVKVNIPNVFLQEVIFPLIPTSFKNYIKKNIFPLIGRRSEYNNFCIFNEEFANRLKWNFSNNVQFKTAKEAHYFEINMISNQSTLEMADKIVSEFFIEPRYPFFDKRLVEFCYAIPTEMKFRFGWNRYIQRMAMENILPKEVQWRPLKKYFNEVYEKNLLLFEKNYLIDVFSKEKLMIQDYMNLEMINQFYNKYISNKGDIVSNRYIWLVLIVELWLNKNNVKQD